MFYERKEDESQPISSAQTYYMVPSVSATLNSEGSAEQLHTGALHLETNGAEASPGHPQARGGSLCQGPTDEKPHSQ